MQYWGSEKKLTEHRGTNYHMSRFCFDYISQKEALTHRVQL